ncbi:hypothetical protein EVAR_83417_1 [Eumeta japonica]|uniref:Uncharacterized protein n=1 Tax=Eumeta variegata TaxID=151549 RepID=A0A4C1TZ61_EUMVA|nr:hypothetical protein EVAR_83417_1 [Eumeta japonica]
MRVVIPATGQRERWQRVASNIPTQEGERKKNTKETRIDIENESNVGMRAIARLKKGHTIGVQDEIASGLTVKSKLKLKLAEISKCLTSICNLKAVRCPSSTTGESVPGAACPLAECADKRVPRHHKYSSGGNRGSSVGRYRSWRPLLRAC